MFVPIEQVHKEVRGREDIRALLKSRGSEREPNFHYVTYEFIFEDWDFATEHWNHWHLLAKTEKAFWGRILTRILEQPQGFWSNSLSAKALHVATTGSTRAITNEPVLPSWIVKFRDLPCLQDTRGNYRQPAELLRRTPDTEPLLDVEPFVHAELDTEANRQLLVMLGVRDTPTGPDRLLDRLQALATVDAPPVYEVEKWCSRLDQIIAKCSTDEFQKIKNAFTHQKLILTTEREWVCAHEVFLDADEEDAPGAAIIHPAIRNLSLWHKIGVAERPTGDLSLKWLVGIPSNKKLSKDELRRVRAILPRYAERIWTECGHWLNLDGEWVPVEQLAYKLTMQTLIPWANLFRPVKQKTADLQRLSMELCERQPFAQLTTLADCIEDRFENKIVESGEAIERPWIIALGSGLGRVELDDETKNLRTRELGRCLARTRFQIVADLETTPYIDGVPSGAPRRIDVLWKDMTLYVENKSMAKMAIAIAQELGRRFGRPDVTDAIKLCFERAPVFVTEYLDENFKLLPPESVGVEATEAPKQEEAAASSSNMMNETVSSTKETDLSAHGATTDTESPLPGSDVPESESSDGSPSDSQADPQSDERNHIADGEDTPAPRRPSQSPSKPKLIERYAEAHGYVKDNSEGRFCHEDGGCMKRASGGIFPWERYSASGELLQCFWDKDHCIEREPLQLDAEVWNLCVKHPEKYTLLLATPDGAPVEYSGKRICDLRDSGRLTLFPASYRLVYDHDARPAQDWSAKGGRSNND